MGGALSNRREGTPFMEHTAVIILGDLLPLRCLPSWPTRQRGFSLSHRQGGGISPKW